MLRDSLVATWNSTLPISLDYDHLDSFTRASITKKITQFYFGTDDLMQGFNVQKLTDVNETQ